MSEDWKEKYLALLEQSESTLEKLEQFRRGLGDVSLTGKGVDLELDQLLDVLRKSVRKSDLPGSNILPVLTQIEFRQNALEKSRDSFSAEINTALRQLSAPLLANGVRKRDINKTLAPLIDRKFPMLQLPELLSQLAKYSKQIEQADKLSDTDNSLPITIGNLLKSKVGQLLDALTVPPSFEAEVLNLKAELINSDEFTDISQFLEIFSQFIIELLSTEQSSLKQYLINLNDPLNFIEQLLHDSELYMGQRDSIHESYGESLQSGLSNIHQNLDGTIDIGTLNKQIKSKLDLLKQEFVEFSQERSAQEQEQANRYQSMKAQFTALQQAQVVAAENIQLYQAKSLTDPLTQLPNRTAWNHQFETEWERFQRYNGNLSLAIVDIDQFKKINDAHGHQVGDNVLNAIAQKLQKHLRNTDFLARFGGEEFSLLLPETNLEDAIIALDHVRKKIDKAQFTFQDKSVKVTISIGVCQAKQSNTAEELFNQADAAMYAAKDAGRNQIKTNLDL